MRVSSWQPPNNYSQPPGGDWSRNDAAKALRSLHMRNRIIAHGKAWDLGVSYDCIWRLWTEEEYQRWLASQRR